MTMKFSPPSTFLSVLSLAEWFAAIHAEVQADVIALGEERHYVDGQLIFARGEKPDSVYAVISGRVSVSGVSREGREFLLDFYGPGCWLGEVAALGDQLRSHDAKADGNAVLLQFKTPELEELLARHPSFSRGLLKLEAQRLILVLKALETYSVQTMEQRLAQRLILLSEKFGVRRGKATEFVLPLSQDTLARLIGTSRQRINQVFKDWEAGGLLSHHYGKVVLTDLERLSEILEG
jgi:CRP/FNR family transcriptional regulator, cyclic AMP receptor protein